MTVCSNATGFGLICVIVNFGVGSKVLQTAKKHGMTGGTVFLGRGTVKSHVLELLGITDERKEIVVMAADRKTADEVAEFLNEHFHFEKPHHGIAFTMPVCDIIGSTVYKHDEIHMEGSEDKVSYNLVVTIVDRGKGEEVVEASRKAGAKGATIVNARGAGIHETSKVFAMEIEPEKEMVLILAKSDIAEAVVSSIREHLEIDQPGKGIIFVQSVNKTYGLHE
ncbi:P-II family nitrogen regulator [Caldicoprobacter faecalis]|uniref:Nitrogen regulatory protein P-II family n=1 Tax=Caldicoprobacter faecalis TaxID=937334 RepID=A0A1I5YN70_9FIRM|nr:P-II family nitrogen regulator [Caldicoprobacter faecalis]SFQ45602.1 nitrogen regulatory protein P-II family [Caldicoprobacter faecalis]